MVRNIRSIYLTYNMSERLLIKSSSCFAGQTLHELLWKYFYCLPSLNTQLENKFNPKAQIVFPFGFDNNYYYYYFYFFNLKR